MIWGMYSVLGYLDSYGDARMIEIVAGATAKIGLLLVLYQVHLPASTRGMRGHSMWLQPQEALCCQAPLHHKGGLGVKFQLFAAALPGPEHPSTY